MQFSDEQFSACAIKCRLCAFWFKELILTDYEYIKGFNATDEHPTESTIYMTTDGDLRLANETLLNKNENIFQNQTQINNKQFVQHLNSLILKLKHFRSLPAFRYMILLIQLLIIFIGTLLTIINLTNTFFRNRTYRIVPQCYVIEANDVNDANDANAKKANYCNGKVCDKQINLSNESNSSNSLNNQTKEEENSKIELPARSTNSIKKPKKLGKLKNELNLMRDVDQIIKLKDDIESAEKESIKVSKNESNYENVQKIYSNLSIIENQRGQNDSNEALKSLEKESSPVTNLKIKKEEEKKENAYYHQCSSEQFATNYLNHLNNQQQKSNNYYPENSRIVSASFIWRNHTSQHLEQKDFATIFIRIYLFFLLTWIPFSLAILTTQLFTFSWKVNQFNLGEFYTQADARMSFGSLKTDLANQYESKGNFETFQQSSSNDSETSIRFNNDNLTSAATSVTNLTGSIDLRRTILLRKLKILNFNFINKLWFLSILFSTFSVFFFQLISRQWLANLAQQKINNLIQFLKNH